MSFTFFQKIEGTHISDPISFEINFASPFLLVHEQSQHPTSQQFCLPFPFFFFFSFIFPRHKSRTRIIWVSIHGYFLKLFSRARLKKVTNLKVGCFCEIRREPYITLGGNFFNDYIFISGSIVMKLLFYSFFLFFCFHSFYLVDMIDGP